MPLQRNVDAFEAHLERGNRLLIRGDVRGAAVSLSAAIALRPDAADPISNLGVALARMGELERAVVCYRQAIAMEPEHAAAHSNLGESLAALGRAAEARGVLERAVELNPQLADAWVNLSATLVTLGDYERAMAATEKALELRPADVNALLNLGNAMKHQGRLAEAAEVYRSALAIAPRDPRPANNLGETLRDQGDVRAAARAYQRALASDPKNAAAYSNLLYLHAFTRNISPAAELALARGFERTMLTAREREDAARAGLRDGGAFRAEPLVNAAGKRRRLRLGIVSAELGTHAVAEFLEPFLAGLDRERFHLTLFPVQGRHCERAARIRALADGYVPLTGLPDAAAVELIRRRGIDVLIDTSGHTLGNRLGIFARRAAPVQATWIGYWSTTGLTEMDYFLADQDPPEEIEAHFAEKLWRLPRLGTCYRGDEALAIEWKPDPEGTVWLGSFNKLAKVREQTCTLWAAALRALPEAKLLLEDRGTHERETQARIRRGLIAHGVRPERVEFIPYVPGHERHMRNYNRLDVALDTVPFNGGTTTFDALWMGVPLVTVEGSTMGARISGAALNALGRPEWVAKDAREFAEIVGGLGRDVALRRKLRAEQRARMMASPLCDAVSLTKAMEEAVEGMYRRWSGACEGRCTA